MKYFTKLKKILILYNELPHTNIVTINNQDSLMINLNQLLDVVSLLGNAINLNTDVDIVKRLNPLILKKKEVLAPKRR